MTMNSKGYVKTVPMMNTDSNITKKQAKNEETCKPCKPHSIGLNIFGPPPHTVRTIYVYLKKTHTKL